MAAGRERKVQGGEQNSKNNPIFLGQPIEPLIYMGLHGLGHLA